MKTNSVSYLKSKIMVHNKVAPKSPDQNSFVAFRKK